jgi:hypothetical protein
MKSSLFQVFIDNTFMTYILLIQLSGLRFGLEKDFTLYNMIAHNRAVLTASEAPGQSSALGSIPIQPLTAVNFD